MISIQPISIKIVSNLLFSKLCSIIHSLFRFSLYSENMNIMIALNGEAPPPTLDSMVRGVGMIRSEYVFRRIVKYITKSEAQLELKNYLTTVCEHYHPKPVWYRTSELTTQEINVLDGADEIIYEKHYELGLRGIRRGLSHIDTFKSELCVVSSVAKQFNNLNILLPFIINPTEFKCAKSIIDECGFNGKTGVMLEIPSVFFLMDEFIECGVDCFTVGINDLTMLVLGAYRGSSYHDTCNAAVIKLISQAEKISHSSGIEFNVAGYMSKDFLSRIEGIPIDNLVVHYNEFPKLFDSVDESALPDMNLVKEIKTDTKKRIAKLNA